MKILKTYEILKMIDENPEKMLGKRYKQVDGLVREDFGIGDIAKVTQYYGIASLGAEKFSNIRIDINGFEEWEEVKEPVDFITAISSGKRIKVEHRLIDNDGSHTSIKSILSYLSVYFGNYDLKDIIINGKWYIED